MTRFRAYVSDSEDDYLSEDPSEHAQDAGSEAGSSANQPDVPSRRGTAESEAETDQEGDVIDEAQLRAASASPPPPNTKPADPTLVPWARDVGVDRQRMHVMQTSLFRVPEEEAALRSISKSNLQPSVKRLNLPTGTTRKHGRDSDGEGIRADSRTVSIVATGI